MSPEMDWAGSLYGERSAETPLVDGGTLVARALQGQKVRYLFTINGGHTFPILGALRDHGVRMIHMRHEQACAFAHANRTGVGGRRTKNRSGRRA